MTDIKEEFKLPDICIKKYKRNSEKEKELIDSIANGDIKSVKKKKKKKKKKKIFF